MNNRINMSIVATLVAAAALSAAPPAFARDGVAVSYRDLDLSQPAGVSALSGRLRAAARGVCGAPEREEVGAYFARRDCYRQAIAQAKRDLEAARPLLASLQQ